MSEKEDKKNKVNRVRLGGGGPYIAKQTFDDIQTLCEKLDCSQGKVVDKAVAKLMESRKE